MPPLGEKKMDKELIAKIRERSLRLAVLGSGYVGLPSAAVFADAGFHTSAIDFRRGIIDAVNRGVSPIKEPGLEELISRNTKAGRLKATLRSAEALSQADAVIISVQTPIDKDMKPDLSFLTRALQDAGKTLKKRMLIIVSSTVPPGTMLNKVKPTLESLGGSKADSGFYLAYVPERIAPGNALGEFIRSPRLIGGLGQNSTRIASELFRTVCKTVIETDAATAEIAKLAENTFRDVNIAFANQLALICEQHKVDVQEAIKLANTHPRVNIHMPGPGVGGPCLPKDPYFLLHAIPSSNNNIIKTARKINDAMPTHILNLITQALENAGKSIAESKVAVLGTAYKGDIADSRLSPSETVIHKLIHLGAEVTTYDPYSDASFGAKKTDTLKEAIQEADCTVIMTEHTMFKKLILRDFKASMKEKPAIIDGRRVLDPAEAENAGFDYYGVGYRRRSLQPCRR
jgi:UDP-N-acetyl-D-mannosaminuronic acid dehydrogenase